MGEQVLDEPTLWGLIEARAAATPDVVMAVDEIGREMTFADYRDQVEVAAAGLAAEHGIGAGDVITWQLPTWLESMVLVGAISRLGATQNPVLPIYREREVGFCARQAGGQAAGRPVRLRRLRLRGHGREDRRRARRRRRDDAPTARCPPAIPPRCRRRRQSGDDVRWLFYTSGTTADPKGAQHTDRTHLRGGQGHGRAPRRHRGRPQRPGLPLHPHRRHHLAVHQPAERHEQHLVPGLHPRRGRAGAERAGRDHGRLRAPSSTRPTWPPSRRPTTPIFPEVRNFPGGGAPKPVELY